jgi:hypothetical protein
MTMDNPLCFACAKRVVPLDNGDCPTCGAALVPPKPGVQASAATPTLRRKREGFGKHEILILVGGFWLLWIIVSCIMFTHDDFHPPPYLGMVISPIVLLWGLIGAWNK